MNAGKDSHMFYHIQLLCSVSKETTWGCTISKRLTLGNMFVWLFLIRALPGPPKIVNSIKVG